MSLDAHSTISLGSITVDKNYTANHITQKSSNISVDTRGRTLARQTARHRADEPMPHRRASATATQRIKSLPVVAESDAETADPLEMTSVITLLEEALRKHPSPPRRSATKGNKTVVDQNESIIYETPRSIPTRNRRSSLLDLKESPVSNPVQTRAAAITEGEKRNDIKNSQRSLCTVDTSPAREISPPVFIQAPVPNIGLSIQQIVSPSTTDNDEDHTVAVRITSVKRKPAPVRTLSEISRERILSKYIATKPYTPSLLSFTEDTTPAQRLRFHPDRFPKTRQAPPDVGALRKASVERSRLVRFGFVLPSRSRNDSEPTERPISPYTFPRAGSLHHLRSMDTNTLMEDWSLGYINLAFIQKTLFAFDLRMRTGHDLWVEEEQEILASFGRHREWETDWEVRWRVASWLMHYSDDEEGEGDDGTDEADLSFTSASFPRPGLAWDIGV